MKVLAVIPDSNVLDRVRWLAKWNPQIEWDVIGVAPDCRWEPVDWAKSFECLDCDYREVKSYPQDNVGSIVSKLGYERSCVELRSPLLGYWYHYHDDAIVAGMKKMTEALSQAKFDILVTWGEYGWYNKQASCVAQISGKPHCRLERSTFPGMFIADGTGLEQGRCDLGYWHSQHGMATNDAFRYPFQFDDLNHWLSVAPWQTIESQPRTTLGMAAQYLDDRPSVFVPLQVPVDTNMVFRSNVDNWGLLEYVAVNYPDHNVLVKKHPGDGFTSDDALQSYCQDHKFQLVTGATHSFLQVVDEVVSINSQVIVEAWMHGLSPTILGNPAFDLPDEPDKQSLLYTLRFAYCIEPWQLTDRLTWIRSRT